jgi:hypothetical protein
MAESAQHIFLKGVVVDVLRDFSKLELYGLTEVDRKRFDFSCGVERDWTRPLVGQVLWKHERGIDKDLRLLLSDDTSEVKVYVVRDNMANRIALEEVLQDFRRTPLGLDLFRLRILWTTEGFNPDDARHRQLVRSQLERQVVDDILLNVVFANLSERDLRIFLSPSGRIGLPLALLAHVAEHTTDGLKGPALALGVDRGAISRTLLVLQAAEFIEALPHALVNQLTLRGSLFLDLLARLADEQSEGQLSPELRFILDRLDCPAPPGDVRGDPDPLGNSFERLLVTTIAAHQAWGIDIQTIPRVTISEAGNLPPGYAMPNGPNALRSGRSSGRLVTRGGKTHIR